MNVSCLLLSKQMIPSHSSHFLLSVIQNGGHEFVCPDKQKFLRRNAYVELEVWLGLKADEYSNNNSFKIKAVYHSLYFVNSLKSFLFFTGISTFGIVISLCTYICLLRFIGACCGKKI